VFHHVQLSFKVNQFRYLSNNQLNFFDFFSARDEEPLDPYFGQFPQSISLEEGGKVKFSCKLSGSSPMTGKIQSFKIISS
jgi:hypothetical protein